MAREHRLNTLYETLEILWEFSESIGLEAEEVGIENALGRFAGQDIAVKGDLPGFERAGVDGFALISGDTFGIDDAEQRIFSRVGQSEAGQECTINLGPNECVYVSAGAMLPPNADAVLPIDDSEVVGPLEIAVNRSMYRGENVIHKSDDYKKEDVLITAGTRIGVGEIGALAGAGVNHVNVFRKIHASVISTGEEVVEPFNTKLLQGKVRDVNSYYICAGLKEMSVTAVNRGIVRDNSRDMEEILEKSLTSSDVIIITGGSSEGTMDKTLSVIRRIQDVEILTDKIGINPGKDTIIARINEKIIYGLPGSPVSALLTMDLLVRPLILWMNKSEDKHYSIKARCLNDYKASSGKEEYVAVSLDNNENEYTALPLSEKAGPISSMIKADGYIKIRASDEEVKEGQKVDVILFR